MYKQEQSLETHQVEKAIQLLGLQISENELDKLKFGNAISLEHRSLSEIGSIFILAEALAATNSVKNITFSYFEKVAVESSHCSGISFYSWNSELFGQCCLFLTLIDGKPAVKASYQEILSN